MNVLFYPSLFLFLLWSSLHQRELGMFYGGVLW